jgi:hypothetical protein
MRALLVLAALLLVPQAALADGDNAHSTIFDEEIVGGGIVSQGLGLARRFGAPEIGQVEIAGIPAGATIVQAFLYWVIIAGFDDTVIVDGTEFVGDWIGTTQDTCWGMGDNHVYRTSVRAAVYGNGTYDVTGFDYTPNVIDNQGFSMVVVYRDLAATDVTRVMINDGAIYAGSGYPVIPSTLTFPALPDPILGAEVHFAVGDSQGAGDGPTKINGTTIATDNWEGSDGPGGDGGMWDDDTFDIGGLGIVQPGQTSMVATISDPPDSDCLAFTVFAAAISYPNLCPDEDVDGWSICDGDCDDTDPFVNPDATEVNNGIDDNCDGIIDNLPVDNDEDGWDEDEDCDDDDPNVSPEADEICDNGVDDDCDDVIDESDCEDEVQVDDDDTGNNDDDDDDDDDIWNPGDDDDSANGDDDDDGGGGSGRSRGGCGCDAAGGAGSLFALLLLGVRRRR